MTYLLRCPGVQRAAEWRSHLAPVGIRTLLANVYDFRLRRFEGVKSYRFERDVRVPSLFTTLFLLTPEQERLRVFVEFFGSLRTDDADLVISPAVVAARIDHRMNMQLRRCWLAGEFAKALGKLLLESVI